MIELDRYMSRDEVLGTLGVSRSTLYAMVDAHKFPPPIPLGAKRVGWSERMVRRWQEQKIAEAERRAA